MRGPWPLAVARTTRRRTHRRRSEVDDRRGSQTAGAKATRDGQDVADGSQGPEKMRLTIYDLRRQGPYVVLDFGITCLRAPVRAAIVEFPRRPPETEMNGNTNTPSAFCSSIPGRTWSTWRSATRGTGRSPRRSSLDDLDPPGLGRYPAPPASVTALDVVFPDGGPQVPNVPITSGSAAGRDRRYCHRRPRRSIVRPTARTPPA